LKKVIRHSVFETASSSMHSIVYLQNNNDLDIQIGEKETVATIHLNSDFVDSYKWGFETHNNPHDKLTYAFSDIMPFQLDMIKEANEALINPKVYIKDLSPAVKNFLQKYHLIWDVLEGLNIKVTCSLFIIDEDSSYEDYINDNVSILPTVVTLDRLSMIRYFLQNTQGQQTIRVPSIDHQSSGTFLNSHFLDSEAEFANYLLNSDIVLFISNDNGGDGPIEYYSEGMIKNEY